MRHLARSPTLLATRALAFLALLFAPVAARAAGGAYMVDDVEIGKPGDCKVESWAQAASNHDFAAVTSPACVVNLGVPVELGAAFARSRSDSVWSTGAGPKAKVNILPAGVGKIGVGLAGTAGWNLTTGQYTGNIIYVPVTFQLRDDFRINVNGGWQYDAIARLNAAYWGAGFEWNFVKPVTLIGEIYGMQGALPAVEEDEAPAPRSIRGPRGQIGLRVTPRDNFDLDFIYGHNIGGENAHWLTLGLNLRF
jgi:hypothetical protein